MDKRTKETVKIFDDAAERYQDKYMDVSSYSEHLSLFCEALSSDEASILDVACGPGNVAKYIVGRLPSAIITSTDLSSKMLELTKVNVPSATTLLLDAKAIKSIDKKYDGILASFIFPYLSKVEVVDFIQDSASILNDEGVLYISTMQGSDSDSGYVGPSDGVQMYINYHEVNYVEQALNEFGFEIVTSVIQPYDYGVDNNGTDIIILAKLKN